MKQQQTTMKLLFIIASIMLASCQKENFIEDCDDTLFLKDNYINNQPGVSGYYYTFTDTLFNGVVCGATLDSLVNVAQRDSINGVNLYTYRYEFKNHNH